MNDSHRNERELNRLKRNVTELKVVVLFIMILLCATVIIFHHRLAPLEKQHVPVEEHHTITSTAGEEG